MNRLRRGTSKAFGARLWVGAEKASRKPQRPNGMRACRRQRTCRAALSRFLGRLWRVGLWGPDRWFWVGMVVENPPRTEFNSAEGGEGSSGIRTEKRLYESAKCAFDTGK